MDAVFDLPIALLAVGLPLVACSFTAAALLLTRRLILPRLRIHLEDSNFGSTILQSVMVFYGLTVALISVAVWQKHSQVEDVVSSEAASIASLWRDLSGYPQPARGNLQGMLRQYTDYTIQKAWPVQRTGRVPRDGVEFLHQFQAALYGFEPATDSQKILHAEALRAYNQMIQYRRLRLDAVDTGLPGVLWTVILAGAVVCLIASSLFRVEDFRYQLIMTSLLGLFVSLVIFVVLALDRPLRGSLGVTADSYQLIYDQLMK